MLSPSITLSPINPTVLILQCKMSDETVNKFI